MAQPDFSVVITTYGRPAQLTRLLETLQAQDYPKNCFEVIVVDDGSPQPLEPVVQPFRQDLQVRLIRQENCGPATGRNNGVASACGTWIAFTDDDCEPQPEWLRTLKTAAEAHPGSMLGGKTVCGLPGQLCATASQLIQETVYDFFNTVPTDARFFASNNMAMPTGHFLIAGGFDQSFRIAAEDRDLCDRWRCAGLGMVYIPDAVVRHCHQMSLAGFVRQHFRYGRGAARFHRERIRRASSRLREHIAFHQRWRSWLLRPWREQPRSHALLLIALMLVWQAANTAGFCYGWLLDGRR